MRFPGPSKPQDQPISQYGSGKDFCHFVHSSASICTSPFCTTHLQATKSPETRTFGALAKMGESLVGVADGEAETDVVAGDLVGVDCT